MQVKWCDSIVEGLARIFPDRDADWFRQRLYCGEAVATTETGATYFASKSYFTYYNIWVGGVQVSNQNKDRIYSPYLTAGTVNYNSDSKTLTLNGVTMNVTADDVSTIKTTSGAGDITIKAIGDNTLTSVASAAKLYSNTTFTSSSIAYLRFISKNNSGISMYGSANATVNMVGFFQGKGAEYGFYGDGSTYPNAVLTLKKATSDEMGYNFTGAEGAIRNLGSLKLDNMDFWYSTYGCYFDEADKRVEVNGGAVAKGQVVFGSIKETLPISVCGKQLNRVNGADNPIYVGSKYISSGTQSVGYVPSTKTLTLNNAKIESVGSHGIEMKLEGNIKLVGTNSLSAKTTTNSRYSAICANKFNITITGDGSLNATSDKNCGIHAHEGIVTITDNVKIDATGHQCSWWRHPEVRRYLLLVWRAQIRPHFQRACGCYLLCLYRPRQLAQLRGGFECERRERLGHRAGLHLGTSEGYL